MVQIIATIGPKSISYPILRKMKKNGMDIGRINTKYGDINQWEMILENLKKLNVQIMVDIKSNKALDWVNTKKIDYLAISYAQNSKQIKKIRNLLVDKSIKIISKIETKKGIKNIDSLIDESFGIMIARGDLSRNIEFERVPYYKKLIIDKCNVKKKFVIIATEMLLSMVKSKKPTNAEVDDVFSSVMDGGDCLMLSEETAIGEYPVLSVKTMRKIIKISQSYNPKLIKNPVKV